jgi:hypothetical protein
MEQGGAILLYSHGAIQEKGTLHFDNVTFVSNAATDVCVSYKNDINAKLSAAVVRVKISRVLFFRFL